MVRRSYQKKELDDLFDIIITSYRSKIAKPDIRIFKEGIKRLKIKPKEAIMIDDENDNLKNARKLGMKTILFKNTKQLKKELKKLGINI